MLLIKINDLKIDGCQPIDVLVERPRETRLKWMEFYDNGEFHRPSSEAEDRINYFIRSQVTP